MSIGKLESFLEKHIEGFFNKKFSSSLELSEVIKQLEREVMYKRKRNRRDATVPNAYFVDMNPEDYQRMCVRRFLDELYTSVEKAVIRLECFMDGQLKITINSNDNLKEGVCAVYSQYEEPEVAAYVENNSNTIVLNKDDYNPPINLPTEYKTASLLAVDGPDFDSYLEFGERQIYIGRRVKNDFILTDTNASRVHAYIAYERHRHVLYDAESLNGTFVNGYQVSQPQLLHAGDEIRIGSSVLLYEVI